MKKSLLLITSFYFLLGAILPVNAQRYVTEIFPGYTKVTDVIYGWNMEAFPNLFSPAFHPLKMDVYTPAGAVDPVAERPLVIVMHTGSYLPAVVNKQTTGSKADSVVNEMCRQFARRGYVAVGMDYRLGWNPQATGVAGQDIRTGTLLQAVYRSVQDAKACVRWFRHDVAVNGNTYGVDTTLTILGGVGTGGYIALAYATLDDPAEVSLPKFLASSTSGPPYNFVAGFSYVNQDSLGGFEGEGGIPTLNKADSNHLGYTSNIQFVFNMGGAMGDSTWMAAGDAPMVCYHPRYDPFAPYGTGDVTVPVTGDLVVGDVAGSETVIKTANSLGNNSCFASAGFTDPYTLAANAINGGNEGLYPFYQINPVYQAGPWEWWDNNTVLAISTAIFGVPDSGTVAINNSLATNPNASKVKALAYIDTIMNYLNPRINYCLPLPTGLNENTIKNTSVTVQPNPAKDFVEITLGNSNDRIQTVRMYDMLGKEISSMEALNTSKLIINRNNLKPGVYLLKLGLNNGEITQKLIFQ